MNTIYLMRHGDAVPLTAGEDESDRALTSLGEAQATACGKSLKILEESPDFFATSPLRRAVQTAKLAAAAAGVVDVSISEELRPGLDPQNVATWLSQIESQSTLLVSHAPSIGRLGSWFFTGDEGGGIHFGKAALMCLSINRFEAGGCELEWFLTADQIKQIAG